MTSKEDLIKLKEVFLEIKQWWLKDDKEKLTEWQEKTFDNAIKDLEVLEILKNAKKINWVGVPPLYEDVEFTITISKENKQKILNWLERKDD